MESLVVKISGNVIDDPVELDKVILWIAQQRQQGSAIIVVHGGGKQINRRLDQLGIVSSIHQGRRVTTPEVLEVIIGVLGGTVNAMIVSSLRKAGVTSCGINGVDGKLTTAHQRPPLPIKDALIDFGLVGEIDQIDARLLEVLLGADIVPVIACLTWSEAQGVLNINADTFANRLAVAVRAKRMLAIMDPIAVLDHEGKPVRELRAGEAKQGIHDGWIKDGMIPKIETSLQALERGVNEVLLTNATGLLEGSGTLLRL
jgi:acetylglutamate kinase